MPVKAVSDAIDARLAAYWTQTPVIDFDTVQEPPSDAAAFVVVQFPVVNSAEPLLGRIFWEEGAFLLVLNVMRGVGKDQSLIWSDELAHLFRHVKFDGVQTFAPEGPVIDDQVDQGNWIIYSLSVPYRFEFEDAVFEPVST